MSRKERRVQVALHRPDATGAVVPALRERLFDVALTAVTVLGQFGAARGELREGAAGACNRASQMVYEHPWSVASHTPAVPFLPRFVGQLLDANGVTATDDLMHEASVQALAMGRE